MAPKANGAAKLAKNSTLENGNAPLSPVLKCSAPHLFYSIVFRLSIVTNVSFSASKNISINIIHSRIPNQVNDKDFTLGPKSSKKEQRAAKKALEKAAKAGIAAAAAAEAAAASDTTTSNPSSTTVPLDAATTSVGDACSNDGTDEVVDAATKETHQDDTIEKGKPVLRRLLYSY